MKRRLVALALFAAAVGGGWLLARVAVGVEQSTTTIEAVAPTMTSTSTTTTTTTIPYARFGDARTVGQQVGSVDGLTMFRGNPTRTFYGEGPVPDDPTVLWSYPDSAMCGRSTVEGETDLWCGTGWTGQPVVWTRPDGITEVIIGAYDYAVHFIDADHDRLHVFADLFRSSRDNVGLRRCFLGVAGHLGADGGQFLGGSGQRVGVGGDRTDAGPQSAE